jgi:PAS domain S-box-containing protein
MSNPIEKTTYRYGVSIVSLAVVYFIAGRLGTLLAIPPGYSTALFPASGFALFAILHYGYKVWPGILIGSFFLNSSISVLEQNTPMLNSIPMGISIGLGATGEALVGAYFLLRFSKSNDPFYQIKSIFIFICFTAGVSSLISATCGTFSVIISGLNDWNQFDEIFLTWWLGDSIGILIITPLLILSFNLPSNRFHPKLTLEGVLLVLSLTLVCKIVFTGWLGNVPYLLTFLPFPFLVWATLRFDKLGVIVSILIVSIISTWDTLDGIGPFAINNDPNASLLLVQTFLGVATSMTWILHTDLIEKRRISDHLRKTEERLKQTEDFSLIIVTHVDLNGNWIKIPSTLCDLLGYTREELLSKNFKSVTHPDDLQNNWSQCQCLIRGEFKSFDLEKRYIRKNGEIIWVYLNCSIVQDDQQNPIHFLIYTRDITERKNLQDALKRYSQDLEARVKDRTQALEKSNRDLEEFAYLASHDLQEPLRKITTFSDRVIEKEVSLNEVSRDYLKRIKKSTERMSNYIYDLLEYSRSTKQLNSHERISLTNVVSQVLEDLSDQIRKNNATIHLGELPTIEADPVQFPKVIQNILSNALKYHREEAAPIIYITSSSDKNTHNWHIEISDNGIGIDEIYHHRIFKPFERLHGRSAFEGSGIGLAICEKVVHRHHGKITVKANKPYGTIFDIHIPQHQPIELDSPSLKSNIPEPRPLDT